MSVLSDAAFSMAGVKAIVIDDLVSCARNTC